MARAPNADEFMLSDNPAEGAHRRRQAAAKQEPLGKAICTSSQSDDTDWQTWLRLVRGQTARYNRSRAGMDNQLQLRAEWREAHKERVRADVATRDGPSCFTKACQNCGAFIGSRAPVCPECRVPATRHGAEVVAAEAGVSGAKASTMMAASTSSHAAQEALFGALVATNKSGDWVVAEIHDQDEEHYQVEYSGWPEKSRWVWLHAGKLQDEEGKWACSEVP